GRTIPLEGCPLVVAAEQPVRVPAPFVAAALVPVLLQPLPHLGVSLERDGGRVERRLHAVLVEQTQETKDACPAAVLVDRLGTEIAILGVHHVWDFGEALVPLVTGSLRVLGTFLLVDAETDDRLGVVRPDDLRRAGAVADGVTTRAGDAVIASPSSRRLRTSSPNRSGCSASRWRWIANASALMIVVALSTAVSAPGRAISRSSAPRSWQTSAAARTSSTMSASTSSKKKL